MYKLGLKVWSTNENYIKEAKRLYDNGIYNYVELYVIPGSYNSCINLWVDIEIPYIIHAPHWRDGMNLADKDSKGKNLALIEEAQNFADKLNANKIILHPGIAGDIKETARQLKTINDERVLIENKPYKALDEGLICNGTTPEEIAFVMREARVGFCLDIGHAICSANSHKIEYIEYLKKFILLGPYMYHLTDGDVNSDYDSHLHFGQGNYDLKGILALLPGDSVITVESEKSNSDRLEDYIKDIEAIKSIVQRFRAVSE